MGLDDALRSYADEFLGHSGVDVHVDVAGTPERLPEHIEFALYRIGQEGLNNVARHAGAKHVRLTLGREANSHFSLTVADDGVGFDLAGEGVGGSHGGGLGIAGMRERAHLVGGELSIESAAGRGTTVRVEVPVPADE